MDNGEGTVQATQLLRDDHKRMKGLFRQFETVDQRAHDLKRGVCAEIFMELEIHSTVEEELFYPAVMDAADDNGQAIVEGAFDDHAGQRAAIDELEMMTVEDKRFDERMNELIQDVEDHVTMEEEDIFPIAEATLADRMEILGRQMMSLRQEMMASPRYEKAQPEAVQNPRGGEQMRKKAA